MSITDAYIAFLRKPQRQAARDALVVALDRAGYRLEASLLGGWNGGLWQTEIDIDGAVWSGRRAWVGSRLPGEAVAGDIWLDTRELVGMLLLPWPARDGPAPVYPPGTYESISPLHFCWLALRPAHGWQFAAFLKLARTVRNPVQIRPPVRPLDEKRILARDEHAPVGAVMAQEAEMYATWLGKGIASHVDWLAASATLSREQLAALWVFPHREWAGEVTEAVYAVVSPDTIETDVFEVLDDEASWREPDRLLFGEFSTPSDVLVRTHVLIQLGLRSGSNPLSTLDVDVRTGISRD